MATTGQLEIVREFIGRLKREVCLRQHHGGYTLKRPGSTRIGFVRYNIAWKNAGKYTVYVYPPYRDPKQRFENPRLGTPRDGWRLFVGPEDADLIQYALSVLRSAYDARSSQDELKEYKDTTAQVPEITFVVRESLEGGYEAWALGHNIVTQAEDWKELKYMLRDAVHCHFDEEDIPKLINIHFVCDEVIEVGEPVSPLQVFEPTL